MEKYSEYKDSSMQWLGEIPSHWGKRKLKYLFTERSEKNHPDEPMLSATQSEGVILQSKYKNRVVVVNTGFEGLKLVKVGDFVIHLRSFQGGIEYAYDQGIISSAYTILAPNQTEYSNFYKYLLKSSSFIDLLKICVTGIREGQNINYSRLKQYFIPLPPLTEQQAIVSYLDDKCDKIDQLLENKAKELELLAEMKQRVIADAVTKGLNPDATMKDSGIPWLQQIPQHWGCAKLKAFCKDNKEKNKENVESQVLSLSYGRVIIKQNINFGLVPDSYETYQIVNPGYIILRLTDLQNDHKSLRTGLVKDRGIITSAYVGLIVNNMDSSYAQLVLHSYDIVKVFYGMGGGLRQSMSYQDIANLYIPIPPIEEQRAIVAHIEEKVSKIDALAEKLQKEIESIKEYKQRLISDVVTGQIKVC